jgi:hypothetical protein
LVWSNHHGGPSLDLLPHTPHWLDVVSTLERDDRFFLQTYFKAQKYAVGFNETTMYRLTIRVIAEEAEPTKAFVYLAWKGNWNSLNVFDDSEWERRKPPVQPAG